MDEPVPRRTFVRRVATDAVHDAGQIAGLTGVAARMVTQGMIELASPSGGDAERVTPTTGRAGATPTPAVPEAQGSSDATAGQTAAPPRAVAATAAPRARLGADIEALLAARDGWWVAVNRQVAGPLVLPARLRWTDGRVWVPTRAGSALALAVAANAHVTLLWDEHDTSSRLLVFGDGVVTVRHPDDAPADGPADPEAVSIAIVPSHAIRVPA